MNARHNDRRIQWIFFEYFIFKFEEQQSPLLKKNTNFKHMVELPYQSSFLS
jgi:hypothetical protein